MAAEVTAWEDGQHWVQGVRCGSCVSPAWHWAHLTLLSEPNLASFSLGHQGCTRKGGCPSSIWVGDVLVQGSSPT